jgi:hypothetical protein
MNTTDSKKTPAPLQLRWLRLKRHLRSCNESTRALRDAARAQSAAPLSVFETHPIREHLCRSSHARPLAA